MTRLAEADPGLGVAPRLRFGVEALLRSYSQILVSRAPVVSLLLVLATCASPVSFALGAGAVVLATGVALVLRYDRDLIRSGLYGYNALLVGLGAAMLFSPTPTMLLLLAGAVALSVLVTAAAHAALGATFNLPALTLPFVIVFYLLLGAAPLLGVPWAPTSEAPPPPAGLVPAVVVEYLRALGAIFFLPRADAGLAVFAALLVSTRIGVLLSLLGYGVAALLIGRFAAVSDPFVAVAVGYNFVFVAYALGGVWFVPSPSSFLLALLGTVVCGVFSTGLLPFLARQGLPLLILPFNLTVFLMLYAMRLRVVDRHPKSVDFLLGTPEENLTYFRTRLARFGARYFVWLRAPFLGRWVVTQAVDGDETHQGPWRHAFDFEVADDSGNLHRRKGRSLKDYHCYKLPVLAPADGLVVKVVDDVPDNPPGELNLTENWGNGVLLNHAPGLYSLLCHLSPGTLEVSEGQHVRAGDTLGRCGSSGRAPRPHLHWHLQATARLGAPTIHGELHHVVRRDEEGETLHGALVPARDDVIRNLEPQADLARRLAFPYGEPLRFEEEGDGGRTETFVPDIDLYGRLLLRSVEREATLVYDRGEELFMVHDVLGSRRSLLHLLQSALSRVPFDSTEGLRWTDHLPLRSLAPWLLRPLFDFVSPFLGAGGVTIDYEAERSRRTVVIRGTSRRLGGDGRPLVRTEAELKRGSGLTRFEVTVRGRRRAARRVPGPPETSTGGDR